MEEEKQRRKGRKIFRKGKIFSCGGGEKQRKKMKKIFGAGKKYFEEEKKTEKEERRISWRRKNCCGTG